MDALTFVVEMTKALAWPVVAVIALLVLRAPLSKVLLSIAKNNPYFRAKWNGKELEIGARDVLRRSEAIDTPAEPNRLEESKSEAQISPKSTIVEAWRDVEESATASLGISMFTSPADLKADLESSNILDKNKFQLFTDLLELRNKAIHIPETAIGTSTAIEYSEAASKLAAYIRKKKESE